MHIVRLPGNFRHRIMLHVWHDVVFLTHFDVRYMNVPLFIDLPLLFMRPTVTSPATEHHHSLASTKLFSLATEADWNKQLGQSYRKKAGS